MCKRGMHVNPSPPHMLQRTRAAGSEVSTVGGGRSAADDGGGALLGLLLIHIIVRHREADLMHRDAMNM